MVTLLFIFALSLMRVIATRTINEYATRYPKAKGALRSWVKEMENSDFDSHNELKEKYPSASVINTKRVVFNINGNNYRLIVDIEYRIRMVFVTWFGPHKDYDKIDAETIEYET